MKLTMKRDFEGFADSIAESVKRTLPCFPSEFEDGGSRLATLKSTSKTVVRCLVFGNGYASES